MTQPETNERSDGMKPCRRTGSCCCECGWQAVEQFLAEPRSVGV